jgi:hypothetical protein
MPQKGVMAESCLSEFQEKAGEARKTEEQGVKTEEPQPLPPSQEVSPLKTSSLEGLKGFEAVNRAVSNLQKATAEQHPVVQSSTPKRGRITANRSRSPARDRPKVFQTPEVFHTPAEPAHATDSPPSAARCPDSPRDSAAIAELARKKKVAEEAVAVLRKAGADEKAEHRRLVDAQAELQACVRNLRTELEEHREVAAKATADQQARKADLEEALAARNEEILLRSEAEASWRLALQEAGQTMQVHAEEFAFKQAAMLAQIEHAHEFAAQVQSDGEHALARLREAHDGAKSGVSCQ